MRCRMREQYTHTGRVQRREQGANLVEMALLLPFLLLIIVGIVDLGGALNRHIAITNAAREGARYGARFPYYATGIISATVQEASGFGVSLSSSNITIAPNPSAPAASGSPITVTVSFSYTTLLGGIIGMPVIPLRNGTSMIVFGVD